MVDPHRFIRTANRRVLVADDNLDAAESMHVLLGAMGCEAYVVHDGLAALALLRSAPLDLAILDIAMPGMDGWEVARRITQESRDPPYLVALSGFGLSTDRAHSLRCGFSEHLVKPLRLQDLERLVG